MRRQTRVYLAMKAASLRYQAGEITIDEMKALAARAPRLHARESYLRERRLRRPCIDADSLSRLDRLAGILARGGTVTALDTGMMRPGPGADEIGISTWRAGTMETITYFDETAVHRHPDPSRRVLLHVGQNYSRALFGPTVAVPHEALARIAQEAADAADVLVMHSMHADMHRIGLRGDPARLLDTMLCGRLWTKGPPSLEDLCRCHGIAFDEAHNSGNDARYTLAVAIALASEGNREMLRDYVVLGAAREQAYHRFVMHPVRAPGLAAVQAERNRTSSAHAAYANAVVRTAKPPRRRKAAVTVMPGSNARD